MSYYNTVNQTGEKLNKRTAKAHGQDVGIYQIFLSNPDNLYSPSGIHKLIFQNAPLTSIRRAMSTLAYEENGYLVKTDKVSLSDWNHEEHCWALNKEKKWDMVTPLIKPRPLTNKGLPCDIDLYKLKKLLKYCKSPLNITLSFVENTTTIRIGNHWEAGFTFFRGNFISAVDEALEYLRKILIKK